MSTHQTWEEKIRTLKTTLHIGEIAALLGVKIEDYTEPLWFEDCASDEENLLREQAILNAVHEVGVDMFEKHHLALVPTKGAYVYRIVPTESWARSANEIRHTINGVGMFQFSSLGEFVSSGPYTARQAVLTHLHWMRDWYRVYDSRTTKGILDHKLRNL